MGDGEHCLGQETESFYGFNRHCGVHSLIFYLVQVFFFFLLYRVSSGIVSLQLNIGVFCDHAFSLFYVY